MTPQYESVIVRQLFDFMENGAVYKGLRPVYWCIHDKTALAEAEIEYANRTSPSVWVKYRLTSDPTMPASWATNSSWRWARRSCSMKS